MQPVEKFSKFFFLFELILQSLPYKLSFGDMFQFFTHCEEPWHGVFVIKKKAVKISGISLLVIIFLIMCSE